MSDLRSACIEAMADAWARLEEGEDYEMPGVAWANLRAVAAVQLDALLGVLEEHAVPMMCVSVLAKAWAVCEKPDADVMAVDLAVLREDK